MLKYKIPQIVTLIRGFFKEGVKNHRMGHF